MPGEATKLRRPNATTLRGGPGKRTSASKPAGRTEGISERAPGRWRERQRANHGRTLTLRRGGAAGRGGRAGLGGGALGPVDSLRRGGGRGAGDRPRGRAGNKACVGRWARRETTTAAPGRPEMGAGHGWTASINGAPCRFLEAPFLAEFKLANSTIFGPTPF